MRSSNEVAILYKSGICEDDYISENYITNRFLKRVKVTRRPRARKATAPKEKVLRTVQPRTKEKEKMRLQRTKPPQRKRYSYFV